MLRGLTGHYVPLPSAAGEKARAFVPKPLPPDPPLDLQPELQELVSQAMLSLGRLDGLAAVLPDPALFIYSYIRKEAVLSSQIEGTRRFPTCSCLRTTKPRVCLWPTSRKSRTTLRL